MDELRDEELQYISEKYYCYNENEGSYPPSINIDTVDKFKFYYKYNSQSLCYFFKYNDSLIRRETYLSGYDLPDSIIRDLGNDDSKLLLEYLIMVIPTILEQYYKKELKTLNDKYTIIEASSFKHLSEKLGKIP